MSVPALSPDPGQILMSFAGFILHGYADGTFVKIERAEDAFKLQVGADGEGARIRNRNRSGVVTFTLQQSSLANDSLSAMAALDELGTGGTGALLVKDLNGTTLCTAAYAWIKKMPSTEFAKDLGHREWAIETNELVMYVGGNQR